MSRSSRSNSRAVSPIEAPRFSALLKILAMPMRDVKDFDAAFAMMAQQRPDVFFVLQDALTLQHRKQIIDFTIQERLPSMFVAKEWVECWRSDVLWREPS